MNTKILINYIIINWVITKKKKQFEQKFAILRD